MGNLHQLKWPIPHTYLHPDALALISKEQHPHLTNFNFYAYIQPGFYKDGWHGNKERYEVWHEGKLIAFWNGLGWEDKTS